MGSLEISLDEELARQVLDGAPNAKGDFDVNRQGSRTQHTKTMKMQPGWTPSSHRQDSLMDSKSHPHTAF